MALGAHAAVSAEASSGLATAKGLPDCAADFKAGSGRQRWFLDENYHCGGFGKTPKVLWQLIDYFAQRYQLPLDAVYTAKALWGCLDAIDCGRCPKGSRLLFIHTGGLQGNRSRIAADSPSGVKDLKEVLTLLRPYRR